MAPNAVRVHGQHVPPEVTRGATELAQRHLKTLGLGHRMSGQQFVNGQVGGEEVEAIGAFESPLAETATGADAGHTEGRFVDQLQGQPWLDVLRAPPGPATEEVPNAQAKQLRDEQPEADQVPGDLIRQALANAAFQALGIRRHGLDADLTGLRRDRLRHGAVAIKFFLKTERLDDPCDAPNTDGEARLPELLSDDLGCGVGVEETVTNDLALDFIGADVVGLGAAFLSLKSEGAFLLKEIEHLVITLPGEAVLLRRGGSAEFAFSLDEHEQAGGDVVGRGDDEFAARADDPTLRQVEGHGCVLQPEGLEFGARHRPRTRVGE
jgi:hypothetical protein